MSNLEHLRGLAIGRSPLWFGLAALGTFLAAGGYGLYALPGGVILHWCAGARRTAA